MFTSNRVTGGEVCIDLATRPLCFVKAARNDEIISTALSVHQAIEPHPAAKAMDPCAGWKIDLTNYLGGMMGYL